MGMLQAGVIPVTPFQQNCTVLFDTDTKEGVVVDPGAAMSRSSCKCSRRTASTSMGSLADPWPYRPCRRRRRAAQELGREGHRSLPGTICRCSAASKAVEDVQRADGGAQCRAGPVAGRRGDTVSFGDHVFEVYHCPSTRPAMSSISTCDKGFAHISATCCSAARSAHRPGGNHQQLLDSILQPRFCRLKRQVGFQYRSRTRRPDRRRARRTNPFLRQI